jgi:hypothetical protein
LSGAAPVSSDRLWHAAKEAAAASIQIIFMVFAPQEDRYPPAVDSVVGDGQPRVLGPQSHGAEKLRPIWPMH